jgi:hypothetical protein
MLELTTTKPAEPQSQSWLDKWRKAAMSKVEESTNGHFLVPKSWLWGLALILVGQLIVGWNSFTELKANVSNLTSTVNTRLDAVDGKIERYKSELASQATEHKADLQRQVSELKTEQMTQREKLDAYMFRNLMKR